MALFHQSLLAVQPTSYLNKLPKSFSPEDRILVVDPMLATGGSMPSCSMFLCRAAL